SGAFPRRTRAPAAGWSGAARRPPNSTRRDGSPASRSLTRPLETSRPPRHSRRMHPFPLSLASPVEHAGALPGTADLVVIGGGVIGIATALFARRNGMHVVVVEKGRIAAEQSSRNWGWVRAQGRDPA